MICWKVDKNSPLPIYKQLVNLVRDSVASGQLRKGEVLPSQRQLAKLLGLSRATIVKAMEEMTDAGLVDIKERNQAVVSDLSTKGVQWNVYFRRSGHRSAIQVVLTAKKLIFPAFVYLQNIRTATQT